MKLRTSKTSATPLSQIKADLGRRLHNVQRVIGRELASKIESEVRQRIPSGGWLSIYRSSLTYRERDDGMEWAIAGMAEIELSDSPANQTLIGFAGTDPFGAVLKPYNPWPIDLIPPIADGYRDNVVARMASPSNVENERNRIAVLLPAIHSGLSDAGATVQPDGNVEINGKKYADLAFMATKLELGYIGFPRIPHWGPAAAKTKTNAKAWASTSEVAGNVDGALLGGKLPSVATMSKVEAEMLAQLREATWP